MSQENVEIVRDSLRLFGANDFDGLADLVHPEVHAYPPRGWPEQGPFEGRDAVLKGLRGVAAEWERHSITDLDVVAAEREWVVVDYTWRVRGSGSGIQTQLEAPPPTGSATVGSSRSTSAGIARRPWRPPGSGSRRCRGRTSS